MQPRSEPSGTSMLYGLAFFQLTKLYFELLAQLENLSSDTPDPFPNAVWIGKLGWQFGCEMHPVTKEYMEDYFRKRAEWTQKGLPPSREWEWYR
ncbi:MAG: hypothetical protein Q9174_007020, partial [Haloplaca sp. 1 TL-2023]